MSHDLTTLSRGRHRGTQESVEVSRSDSRSPGAPQGTRVCSNRVKTRKRWANGRSRYLCSADRTGRSRSSATHRLAGCTNPSGGEPTLTGISGRQYMYVSIVNHDIEDFVNWKAVDDGFDHGSLGVRFGRINRNVENPNNVTIIQGFDSAEPPRRSSPTLRSRPPPRRQESRASRASSCMKKSTPPSSREHDRRDRSFGWARSCRGPTRMAHFTRD